MVSDQAENHLATVTPELLNLPDNSHEKRSDTTEIRLREPGTN
jgi:hypothetical protein